MMAMVLFVSLLFLHLLIFKINYVCDFVLKNKNGCLPNFMNHIVVCVYSFIFIMFSTLQLRINN